MWRRQTREKFIRMENCLANNSNQICFIQLYCKVEKNMFLSKRKNRWSQDAAMIVGRWNGENRKLWTTEPHSLFWTVPLWSGWSHPEHSLVYLAPETAAELTAVVRTEVIFVKMTVHRRKMSLAGITQTKRWVMISLCVGVTSTV